MNPLKLGGLENFEATHFPGAELFWNFMRAFLLGGGLYLLGGDETFWPSQSMNGMQLHSHMPTHASIYLGVLLLHLQNLYDELIGHQHFSKCAQLSFCK